MNTFEFEITIQGKSGDNSWPIVVRCKQPDGLTIHSKGMLQLSQDDFYQLTAALEDEKEYGTLLGKALFQENVRDIFVRALSKSSEDCFLRILLSVEAAEKDEVRTLHWERLCAPIDADGAWHLLARDRRVPFSLYIPTIIDRRFPPIGRRDLRALVLVASPDNLGAYQLSPFDVQAAISGVGQALGKIPYDILANNVKGALGPPTLEELSKQLTNAQKPYTLLHFVCHGMLSNDAQRETALFWATADNQVQRVTGKQLLDELRYVGGQKGLPHFAFLCSCETADPRAEGALGGLAQRLVRDLGMPAVVAMTRKVSVKTALALGESFYQRLGNSGVVDVALQEATAGLGNRDDITVPALFSRLGGRPLFSDRLENRELTDAEIEYGIGKLQDLLKERAPNASRLNQRFQTQAKTLENTLRAESSPTARDERKRALIELNNICDQILDFSFDELAASDKKPPEYKAECPFPGLSSFGDKKYHKFFFGRDELIQELQNKLHKDNFLAVIGPSGSGKSSVVLAGLIPKLKEQQPSLQWVYLTPGREPSKQLEKRLERLSKVPHQHSLLVVDQFEELFTLCDDGVNRQEFIKKLLTIAQQQKVIITMRADFLGECTFYPELSNRIETRQKLVGPMTPAELVTVMKMQADGAGLRFETGLSNSILNDVQEEPGAMPLLQYALQELWKRRHGRWLCNDEYGAIGRVQQAIAKTANDFYNSLPNSQQKNQVRDIFLRLTRLDESTVQGEKRRDTRRRVTLEDLVPIDGELAVTKKLVQQLAGEGARLVVTSRNETTGKEEVEVAHEALIRYWPMLQEWLDENRTNLLLREKIRQESFEWNQHERHEDSLEIKGAQLVVAESLLQQPMFLNKLEAEYVKACVELRDRLRQQEEERRQRELEQEKKARKAAQSRNRVATISAGVLAVLAGFALYQWRVAGRQSVNALAQTSEASLLANKQLEAMVAAIQAGKQLKAAYLEQDPSASQTVSTVLQQAIYNVQERNRLEGHSSQVMSIAFSRDGKTIASGSYDNTIKLWDVVTGKQIITLNGHSGQVNSVEFSRDGKTLASGSYDNTIKLWDVVTGKKLKTLNGHSGAVTSVAFSPDGKTIASGSSDNTIKLWDVALGKQFKTLNGHTNHILSVVFSPDGKTIASGSSDNTIKLWDVALGKQFKTLNGHTNHILSVVFSPDGKTLASGSADRTIKLWNVALGKQFKTLNGHTSAVFSVAFSPDGKTLASDNNKTIKLWDVATGKELKTLNGHDRPVSSVAFGPDGKILASVSFDDPIIKLWDVAGGKQLETVNEHSSKLMDSKFSPDGKILASASLGTIIMWDVAGGRQLKTLNGHSSKVTSFDFSPDDKTLASGSDDGTIKLWDVVGGKELKTLNGHSTRVTSVAFSPDAKTLASGSDDNTIRLWDVAGIKQPKILNVYRGDLNSIAFSPDSKTLAFGSSDNTIKLWDLVNGKELKTLNGHSSRITSIAFSRDSKTLAFGSSDNTIKLWDLVNGKELKTLNGDDGNLDSIPFSPDGKTLAFRSSDDTIKLWDLVNGKELKTLNGHSSKVTSFTFSPDGKTLASGSFDDSIKLWNVLTGKEITTLKGHNAYWSIAFSPDGKTLASRSYDNTIKLWNVYLDDLNALMMRSCDSIRAYLQTNPNVSESDRHLCDDYQQQAK
ncbi:nSTAND1 domain-containing NTPase [Scytonema sp. HK-05]|uniref:nSTAND1 domain-containing NTPase n=1 Tax=Scytonema sp. HK-05 TaxID=1137095 RepID=UPI00093800CE|nr:CHAT domain-containing protein [Scytonema sp. HK-05]OKH49391.1 hypothetical protein NIES2130_34830 [Scytonema sp. HK-05]